MKEKTLGHINGVEFINIRRENRQSPIAFNIGPDLIHNMFTIKS